jgi:hypothetical protein
MVSSHDKILGKIEGAATFLLTAQCDAMHKGFMLRQTISVRLSDALIRDVEALAAELSVSLGFKVTPSDVMRRAIERHIRVTVQPAREPPKTK